ncbi:MAG: cyclase family protein [Actinomycetota bacterium]|nr:cyclase family protein [Actinomycetota bacterium]
MTTPAYESLPLFGPDLPIRHARAYWGADSRIGTLARITHETRLAALAVPTSGRAINLSLSLDEPRPPLFGRRAMEHVTFDRDRNTVEDRLEYLDLQGSSQWDGLRHIRARQYGVFNSEAAGDEAELGIHKWVEHGLVFRAVLADLPRYWASLGLDRDPLECRSIDAVELADCLEWGGEPLRSGDLLLVRTGWLAASRLRRSGDPTTLSSTGLAATDAIAKFLWDSEIAALAMDNPAIECVPRDPGGGFLHRLLIPALGMPLGELWDLDELARHCGDSGRVVSCVISVPLHLRGSAGTPANAVALV